MEPPNNPLVSPNVVMGSCWGVSILFDPLRGLGWRGSESALACQGGCGAKFGEDAIGPYGPMSVLSLGIVFLFIL